jgi:hypothetical protein
MRAEIFALPARRVRESAASRKLSELGVRCVVASLSIAKQIPKAARGRPHTGGQAARIPKVGSYRTKR